MQRWSLALAASSGFSASLQQASKCKARLLLNELQFAPAKAARFRTRPRTLLLGLVVLGTGTVPQLGQDGAGRCGDTTALQDMDSPVPGAAEAQGTSPGLAAVWLEKAREPWCFYLGRATCSIQKLL